MSHRKSFTEQFFEILDDGELITHLVMTNEAHFHLSGYISQQNFHYWVEENSRHLL
jgi:hypothetical protein